MIENTQSSITYIADGVQTQFDFPYDYYGPSDIQLYITESNVRTQIPAENYSFDVSTHKVTYPLFGSPVAAGVYVELSRQTPATQLADSTIANFKSSDVEKMADKLTIICQDIRREMADIVSPEGGAIAETVAQAVQAGISTHNAASSSHTDNLVAKTGSTMTGDLTMAKNNSSVSGVRFLDENDAGYRIFSAKDSSNNKQLRLFDISTGNGLFLNGGDGNRPYYWDGISNSYKLLTTADSVGKHIGEIVPSTVPLTDAGLHLLDGALISRSGSYEAFVDYIAGLVTDYPDLFETEANWQSSVSTYGVCGKFVYDGENSTVRLPKITGFIEGTTDPTALGDLVEAGLPNLEGTGVFAGSGVSTSGTGVFTKSVLGETITGTAAETHYKPYFDASDGNSIYGNSNTVQPQAIKTLYYIVIATTVKTDIQVNIDEIATDLNGKADVDLTNVNATGTSKSAGWAMPSNVYDSLTLGASEAQYTAPANGFVNWEFAASALSFYRIRNLTTDIVTSVVCDQAGWGGSLSMPVRKGDVFEIAYQQSPTSSTLRFYYAEGSKSEAN